MGERRVEDLDEVGEAKQPAAPDLPPLPPKREEAPQPLVDINYPEPTPLSVIVRDVSRWSSQCFVMEPSVNAKLQIFAPHKLVKKDAYDLFLASLSVVNLRAVQIGKVVKIVPVTLVVAA